MISRAWKHGWNRFWFAPRAPGALGLFRIAFGVLVLCYTGLLWPDRYLWFSEQGVLTRAQTDIFLNLGFWVPRPDVLRLTGDAGLTPLFVVYIFSAILVTIGLWSRPAALLVWFCTLTLHDRNLPIHNAGDVVVQVMAAYLFFSPCGAACSVDRLWRILRGVEGDIPAPAAQWAQRLMQLQVATVYASTSLSKLTGQMWTGGVAVWFPLHLPDSRRFAVPLVDTFPHVLVPILTYGTLAIETSLWTLVWFPRLRLWVLAAGVGLHLGIEYALNIPLFSALMVASYLVFLRQSDLERFAGWVGKRTPSQPSPFGKGRAKDGSYSPSLSEGEGAGGRGLYALRVVYDGECDFCKSSLLIVHFLDALHLITFVDYHDPAQLSTVPGVQFADAERAAIAVDRKNRQHAGFYAFRKIAWRLPAAWFLAPLLYVPGVPFVGTRVYYWVTQNRSRLPVAPRYKPGTNAPKSSAFP